MRKLIALASFALLVSCGGDSTAPLTLSGTYNLTSVNGSGLPYIAQASGPKIEILSDQIVAGAGTFSEIGNYRFTNGTTVTLQPITDLGTFTIDGAVVTFRYNEDGSIVTGTLTASTVTIVANGFSAVYVK